MATAKQVAANQRNAKRSTGPRTERGTNVAKLNALRHGLQAECMLIPGEKLGDLKTLSEQIFEELAPETEIERALVGRIVSYVWRLRRIGRLEAALFEYGRYYVNRIRTNSLEGAPLLGATLESAFEKPGALSKLGRYERELESGFYKALRELSRIQEERRNIVTIEADDAQSDDVESTVQTDCAPSATKS